MPNAVKERGSTRLAIAATTGNLVCITAAVSATFGTFLVPIATEFGWRRATVSGVLGLIAILSALSYPLIGRAMDRFGARPLILSGNALLALAIALLALARGNVWFFYLQFALVGLAGAVCSTPMIAKVVSNWFDARRGLMLGVTAGVGNGVGATAMPIIAGLLLPIFGWRGTYAAIGAIVLCVGFPILWLWLRDGPASGSIESMAAIPDSEGMTLAQAIRTPRFWLLLLAVASGGGAMTAVFTHVVPMMMDRGYGIGEATGVIAIFALMTSGWQVVTGGLLDAVRSPLLIAPMYFAAMAGLALLQFGHGGAAMSMAGVLLGIGMGAEYAALPYFCSRYFNLRHFGSINGVLYGAVMLAQGLTPAALDMSFDRTGNYDQASLALIGILAGGMVLLFFLPSLRSRTRHGDTMATTMTEI